MEALIVIALGLLGAYALNWAFDRLCRTPPETPIAQIVMGYYLDAAEERETRAERWDELYASIPPWITAGATKAPKVKPKIKWRPPPDTPAP